MTNKELMQEYLRRFRLECHYRLDMTASEYDEMPVHIYKGAHKGALDEMVEEYKLDQHFRERLDNIYCFFEEAVVREDNYNTADELTVKAIDNDQF